MSYVTVSVSQSHNQKSDWRLAELAVMIKSGCCTVGPSLLVTGNTSSHPAETAERELRSDERQTETALSWQLASGSLMHSKQT